MPSKASAAVPVPNRNFGLFEDGNVKVRGIEVRKRDTPEFFAKCQAEILKTMTQSETTGQVRELMPEVNTIFEKYVDALRTDRCL